MASISVLIVDDQPLQREGLRMVLDTQRGIDVVGEAGDGASALAFVRRTPTDVVLMDTRMPRVNGLVACERIRTDAQVRAQGLPPRVVLLTALDLEEHIPLAAQAGAFAVLYKDVRPEALVEAVKSAAAHRVVE